MNQTAVTIAERVAVTIQRTHPAPTAERVAALLKAAKPRAKKAVLARLASLKRTMMLGSALILFGAFLVMWGVISI